MGTLNINEEVLKEVLAKDILDNTDKRELIHAYYVRAVTKHNFLTEQTSYGDCQIFFDINLPIIDNYEADILIKLNHQVTLEEFKHATGIIENICRMTESEISISKNLIDQPFKKLIGLNPIKTHKM